MSPTAVQDFTSDMRRIRQSLRVGEYLIVDDDLSVVEYLGSLCRSIGEKAVTFRTMENAKWYLLTNYKTTKMAIIDYMLEDRPSDELIKLCNEFNVPCIIHTGHEELIESIQTIYPELIVISKCSPIERVLKELL